MPDRPGTDMSHEHEWRHGEEWKQQARDPDYGPITEESNMTDRVDRETVEATVNRLHESKASKDVRVDAMHTIRTLLAERDALEAKLKTALDREAETHRRHDARFEALEAENQRLRECLEEAQNAPEPDHHCPQFRHVMDIVGAALAEQEKRDDQQEHS